MEVKKERGIGIWIAIIVALAVALVVVIVMAVLVNSPAQKYKTQLKLAERYLDELDYDRAVAAYRAAIDIDPENPEAYEALAELYLEQEDKEAAIEVLKEALDNTESRKLEKLLAETEETEDVVAPDVDPTDAGISEALIDVTEKEKNEETEERDKTEIIDELQVEEDPVSEEEVSVDFGEQWSIDLDGSYSSWQEAYISWIRNVNAAMEANDWYSEHQYFLVYIDGDEIPELFMVGSYEAEGECIVSYYDGHLSEYYLNRLGGTSFIPYSGRVYNCNGNSDCYPIRIAYLYKGEFYKLGEGMLWNEWSEHDGDFQVIEHFEWEGEEVSEEELAQKTAEVFDTHAEADIYDNTMYTSEEMIRELEARN